MLLLGCHHRVPLPTAGSGGDPLCNFLRKPGCTLRCGWEAALLSSPVSHLTAGLRQAGPPRCRGNEALEAPLGLAFHGNCIDRRPPVLGSQCLRIWAPIPLRYQCQEVKLLWEKMDAGAFFDPILTCSFPSRPSGRELERGILEILEEQQYPASMARCCLSSHTQAQSSLVQLPPPLPQQLPSWDRRLIPSARLGTCVTADTGGRVAWA